MITDIICFVVGAASGFIGGFIVTKYESKTAATIQSTVNDVTASVQSTAEKVATDVNGTASK